MSCKRAYEALLAPRRGCCLFYSQTGPGESEQQNDRYTVAGDALPLPDAVIADVIQATRIFTTDTLVPRKEKANIGFVCLCVCQLVFLSGSSSEFMMWRVVTGCFNIML